MANVAYIRVSAIDQNPERQIKAIKAVTTIDKLFLDKASSTNLSRPELEKCLMYLREGDTLFVSSIDRLASKKPKTSFKHSPRINKQRP